MIGIIVSVNVSTEASSSAVEGSSYRIRTISDNLSKSRLYVARLRLIHWDPSSLYSWNTWVSLLTIFTHRDEQTIQSGNNNSRHEVFKSWNNGKSGAKLDFTSSTKPGLQIHKFDHTRTANPCDWLPCRRAALLLVGCPHSLVYLHLPVVEGLIFYISATPYLGTSFPLFHGIESINIERIKRIESIESIESKESKESKESIKSIDSIDSIDSIERKEGFKQS